MNKILRLVGFYVNVILGLISYPIFHYYNVLYYPEKRLDFYNKNPGLKTFVNEKSISIIIIIYLLLLIGINLA